MMCMITISWIHDVLVGGSGLLRLVAVVFNSLYLPRSLALASFWQSFTGRAATVPQ